MSLYENHVTRLRVLQARADAGDRRAQEALDRVAAVPQSLGVRETVPPSISAWMATWPLGHFRNEGESFLDWVVRECRGMGMSLAETQEWFREASRG